jgi:hypothetical protein
MSAEYELPDHPWAPPIFVSTPSIQAGETVDVRLSLGLENANAALVALNTAAQEPIINCGYEPHR